VGGPSDPARLTVVHGRQRRFIWSVARERSSVVGGSIVLGLAAVAAVAPLLAPHGPGVTAFDPYVPPGSRFVLGTDHLGRDVLSRVVWGARWSRVIGFAAAAAGVPPGALCGLISAWSGGVLDLASQRIVDALLAVPPVVVALALAATLGASVETLIVALALPLVPIAARTVRAVALGAQASLHVEAARATGCSDPRIVLRHVLPAILPTFVVLCSVSVAQAIVLEATLSFLGVSPPPEVPSWGEMMTGGVAALEHAPWIALTPGVAISVTVLGLNLLGDGIRDLTDPRLRDRLE
jgi:peptide/nickel transport system permease protein